MSQLETTAMKMKTTHRLWEPVEGRALPRVDRVTKVTSCPRRKRPRVRPVVPDGVGMRFRRRTRSATCTESDTETADGSWDYQTKCMESDYSLAVLTDLLETTTSMKR